MKLTGRMRYRAGWFGRLVLQVEYAYREARSATASRDTYTEWRDARIEDFPPLLDPRLAEIAIVPRRS